MAGAPVEMVRLCLDDIGAPTLLRRGRGAHVHPRARCVSSAAKRGLSRAFRREVRVREATLAGVLVDEARAVALASIERAARGHVASVSALEVASALDAGAARLCVVAVDAREDVNHPAIARAIGTGRAVALGSRRELGALVRRDEADVVGIHHVTLAARIAAACATIDALRVMSVVSEVG